MEVVNRDRLPQRLARNEGDLYVMGVPPDDIDIDSRPLVANPLVVAAPASHPLAKRRRVRFAESADQIFLMREQGSRKRIRCAPGRAVRRRVVPVATRRDCLPDVRLRTKGKQASIRTRRPAICGGGA
jgi:DNA-binding transcriptional LysR family regulator